MPVDDAAIPDLESVNLSDDIVSRGADEDTQDNAVFQAADGHPAIGTGEPGQESDGTTRSTDAGLADADRQRSGDCLSGSDLIERNLGVQPLAALLEELGLRAHDLVDGSTNQMTHKMVSRAMKGRRLTKNAQHKVLATVNQVAAKEFKLSDLFNYS